MKRFTALVTALVLTISLVVPAGAAQLEQHTIQIQEEESVLIHGYPEPTASVASSARAGETVTVEGSGYPYKILAVQGFSSASGETLFWNDAETFTMPDEDINIKIYWMADGNAADLALYSLNVTAGKDYESVFPNLDLSVNTESAHRHDEITVTAMEGSSGSLYLNHLDIYDTEGNYLFRENNDNRDNTISFPMPESDIEIKAFIAYTAEPIRAYTVQIESPEYLDGIRLKKVPDNDVFVPRTPVKITYEYTTEESKKYRVIIHGLDIFDLNGELLTSVEGDTFTMLDEDVVVKAHIGVLVDPVTVTPTPSPKIFKDVDTSTPHYAAIEWAKNKGITKGYSDGTFRPAQNCTRGDMVMFIWSMNGRPAPKSAAKSPFSDVPKSHVYYKAVLWAYQKGITKGYSDGTFKVDKAVTRGEAVRFLWNLKGQPKPGITKNPFKDLSQSYTHYKAVLWAYQKGITKGYKDGTFRAGNNATRGEVVEFLRRF